MKAIVAGNWKMYPATGREAKALFDATRRAADKASGVSVIVAPPSIYLRELSTRYRGKKVSFAGQDAHWEKEGAHTGSISIPELKDARATYVIVGHSERRAAGESDEDTRKIVAAALQARMTPILCVGERSRDADGGHFNFVRDQLRAGFGDVAAGQAHKIIVAYEPIWAIGGEVAMQPFDMHEMAIFIRKSLHPTHQDSALNVRVLYGGSVNETNAAAMIEHGGVQGLLVGHVSVEAKRFAALIASVAQS